ncbi:MAG: hypothetical protein ACREJB_16435 [Planctomycetaceae bacterium]
MTVSSAASEPLARSVVRRHLSKGGRKVLETAPQGKRSCLPFRPDEVHDFTQDDSKESYYHWRR